MIISPPSHHPSRHSSHQVTPCDNNTSLERAFFVGSFNTFASAFPDVASAFLDNSRHVYSTIQEHAQTQKLNGKKIGEKISQDKCQNKCHDECDVLYIPPSLTYEQPIFLSTLFPRHRESFALTVIVDQRTSVSIYDDLITHQENTNIHVTHYIQYWVEENAHLRLFYLQDLPSPVHAHTTTHTTTPTTVHKTIACYLGSYSTMTMHCLLSGATSTSTIIQVYMYGIHAQAHIFGTHILKDTHDAHVSVYQKHRAPHTTSHVAIRGVIKNNAHLSYNGLIVIDPEAAYSHATQENKNILLDPGARAQSVPSLEIFTNEVQCSHGSAISYLDPEQLFYAQSRGLDVDTSRRILIESFALELFDEKALSSSHFSSSEHLRKLLS